MSPAAETNIEAFILSRGMVDRTAIYTQFELVSKRVVDDALTALLSARRISGDGKTFRGPSHAVDNHDDDESPNPAAIALATPVEAKIIKALAEAETSLDWKQLKAVMPKGTQASGARTMLARMVAERMITKLADGRFTDVQLKAPPAPIQQRSTRGWDERRTPITPVEAVEQREASAEAASEVQETVATSTLAADVPDASAAGKTPAPEIGPAPAVEPAVTSFMRGEDLAAPKYEPHPDDVGKTAHIVIEPKRYTADVARWDCRWYGASGGLFETLAACGAEERADRLLEDSQQEGEMSEINDTAPPVGTNAQAPGTAPVATFHVELPGLHIAISGEAKAVMQAVSALEKTLAQ